MGTRGTGAGASIEDVSVIFMTQLLPSSTHPIRTQLRQLVYSALVDDGAPCAER